MDDEEKADLLLQLNSWKLWLSATQMYALAQSEEQVRDALAEICRAVRDWTGCPPALKQQLVQLHLKAAGNCRLMVHLVLQNEAERRGRRKPALRLVA